MLTRIVRMTFVPEKVSDFLLVFHENRDRIAGFDGCLHLELHHDADEPNVYFTISRWRSPKHLEKYRQSTLFSATWMRSKALFAEPAQAWSLEMDFDSKTG
jgi:quinol monooxygenase YgiN